MLEVGAEGGVEGAAALPEDLPEDGLLVEPLAEPCEDIDDGLEAVLVYDEGDDLGGVVVTQQDLPWEFRTREAPVDLFVPVHNEIEYASRAEAAC